MLTIWHNPRCRKSRETLALIETAGADVTVRRYLDDVPSVAEIEGVLAQLGFEDPRALMRRGETIYKETGLKSVTVAKDLVKAMADHPILIERPIVSNGTLAIIGRPPEAVKALLS
jgi:arsenate reductase